MNVETVRQGLESLGADEAPAPRPSFITDLEESLRRRNPSPLPVPVPPGRNRQRGRGPAVPALAFAMALVVLVALLAVRPGGSDHELRVATAVDATVVLPDGTVGPAAPGQVVPDGARILTGSEGHLTAGETELGPNQEAVVRSGVLAPDPTPRVAAPPTTVTTRAPVTTATTTRVTVPDTTPTTTAVRPVPTTEPTTVKTEPVVTRTTDPETVSTKPAQPAEPVALKLESVVGNGGAKLRWSAYQGRAFAAYLVLRAPAPEEPAYPVAGSTTQVGRPLTDQWTTATFDQVDKPEGHAYRVVAVDRDGRVLGISGVVRPTVPDRQTTDSTAGADRAF
jgi:hypothetical protein